MYLWVTPRHCAEWFLPSTHCTPPGPRSRHPIVHVMSTVRFTVAHQHPTSVGSHEPNPLPLSLLLLPSRDPPYKYSLSCLIPFLPDSLPPCLHQPKCLRNYYLRAVGARSVWQRSPRLEGQRGHHIKLRKVKPGLELAQEREVWYSLQTWEGNSNFQSLEICITLLCKILYLYNSLNNVMQISRPWKLLLPTV